MSKPLSARAIETMKPGDKVKVDTGEYIGLRVTCGKGGTKTFTYRYKSPETGKLAQIKIGRYPQVSLAEARVALQDLKAIRNGGVCPRAEQVRKKDEIRRNKAEDETAQKRNGFTIKSLVEIYLSEFIEDRYVVDLRTPGGKKRISGARKPKGQSETRRTLYGDPVRVLGDIPAASVTRKQVVDL